MHRVVHNTKEYQDYKKRRDERNKQAIAIYQSLGMEIEPSNGFMVGLLIEDLTETIMKSSQKYKTNPMQEFLALSRMVEGLAALLLENDKSPEFVESLRTCAYTLSVLDLEDHKDQDASHTAAELATRVAIRNQLSNLGKEPPMEDEVIDLAESNVKED